MIEKIEVTVVQIGKVGIEEKERNDWGLPA